MTLRQAQGDRREGRGQLSSIDLLPEEAGPEIVWALEQLRERRQPQNAILAEFNARLADRGIGSISKSSFNRYSVRRAILFRKIDDRRRIMVDVKDQLGPDKADDVTMIVSEMLKIAVFDRLEDGAPDTPELEKLARILRHSVKAQSDTLDVNKARADLQDRLDRAVKAVAEADTNGIVNKDTLSKITSLLTTGSM